MNTYNFLQNGGFPFELDILDGMQKAYEIFHSLGALAGDLTIISGCIVSGTVVSNGYVHINGEILRFVGGAIGANVIIEETTQSVEFQDLSTREIKKSRIAKFGVGATSYPWANFKRPNTTTQLTSLIESLTTRVTALENTPTAFVEGMVMVWNRPANEIPIGWEEYTELRGRMPIGLNPNYVQGVDSINYGLDTLNFTGGNREKTLVQNNIPKFDFTDNGVSGSGNTDDSPGGGTPYFVPNSTPRSIGTANPTPITVLSPYRVVHFIKYVGI